MNNFKSVLRSSLIFLAIVVLISEIITYPYFHGETYHYQDGYVRDKMAGEMDFLICGASQAQRGISTSILDERLQVSSYNLASPLMTIMGRYTLLEKELERNPVDTVIIELCYDSMVRDRDVVGPEGDYYLLGRFSKFSERAKYFLKAARFHEYAEFYNDTLTRGIKSWEKWEGNEIGTADQYVEKGYEPLATNPIKMIEPELYNKEKILTDIVAENEIYLEKILALCKEKNVHVVIVATPLADAAILSYDKLDVIHEYYKNMSEKWGYEYYNFSLYKGKSDIWKDQEAYYDRNHLSQDGAMIFTEILADIVEDSLQGITSYELFYDSFEQAQTEGILPYYGQK